MDKKQEYIDKMKAQLDEFNAKIDVLKAKAEKAEADTKLEYQEAIEDIKVKQAHAKNKLAELRDASGNAWDDLQAGAEQAWKNLGQAIKSATDHFKQ